MATSTKDKGLKRVVGVYGLSLNIINITIGAGIFALPAIISINLAFLNILPIPGLDGGHIFFTIIEGIIRRDLPLRLKLGIQQVGMLLLLSIMVLVIYNDIARLFN